MRIFLAVFACITLWGCVQIRDEKLPQKATQLPQNIYESLKLPRAQSYYIDYVRMRRGFAVSCQEPLSIVEIEPPELSVPLAKIHRNIALNTHRESLDSLPNVYWAEPLEFMLQKHFARVLPRACYRTTRIAADDVDYRLLSFVHDFSIFADANDNGLRGVVDIEFWLLAPKSGEIERWRLSAQENIGAPYDMQAAVESLNKAFSRVVESNFMQMATILQPQGAR
ncbi:MAG: PqiC family protein [Helicobacter sp.]|nr:PqiC family protein [Helicobacter sp.]